MTILSSNQIQSLVKLPQRAVVAFVSHKHKVILVQGTSNSLEAITRFVQLIRDSQLNPKMSQIIETIEIKCLETIETSLKQQLLLRTAYWIKYYQDNGYTCLNEHKPIKFRISTSIDVKYRVNVYLVSSSFKKLLVGTFSAIAHSERWIDTRYPDRDNIYNIVLHPSVKK